jgi:hypothetical protein
MKYSFILLLAFISVGSFAKDVASDRKPASSGDFLLIETSSLVGNKDTYFTDLGGLHFEMTRLCNPSKNFQIFESKKVYKSATVYSVMCVAK